MVMGVMLGLFLILSGLSAFSEDSLSLPWLSGVGSLDEGALLARGFFAALSEANPEADSYSVAVQQLA